MKLSYVQAGFFLVSLYRYVDFQSFLLLFENHFRNYFCSFLACSDFGSQVSSTPSLRNSRIST